MLIGIRDKNKEDGWGEVGSQSFRRLLKNWIERPPWQPSWYLVCKPIIFLPGCACLSDCLYLTVCLCQCLTVHLSVCLSVCLFVCLSVYLTICTWLSLFLSVSRPVCLSVHISVWLTDCLSVCLSLAHYWVTCTDLFSLFESGPFKMHHVSTEHVISRLPHVHITWGQRGYCKTQATLLHELPTVHLKIWQTEKK